MVDQIKPVTAAEFFELPESNLIIQLIEGEIIQMAGATLKHQDVVGDLFIMFKNATKSLGGWAIMAPFDVYLDEFNVPQPDVMWIAPNSQGIVSDKRLIGAPDLIAEVLSASTERYDRKVKFGLYEKYGVREYWLVNPELQLIEVWRLREAKFAWQGIYEPGDTFVSGVLGGHTIDVKTIFGG
jgi:Uma2 family endonuclease